MSGTRTDPVWLAPPKLDILLTRAPTTCVSRRRSLGQSDTPAPAGAVCGTGIAAADGAESQLPDNGCVDAVKALLFDVFGTLVDWRGGVAREARIILEPRGYELDWHGFADAWRAEYQPAMEEVRAGRIPFSKLDAIHRRMLDHIRPRFGLNSLDEDALQALNLAWHRLDAWPGVTAALHRLRPRYLLAPCSNGNISLMVDLARRNDFPWDAILGAEIAADYKPKPRVYLASAAALGLSPGNCMMVAAHSDDLKAAAACGLRTAHVAQPNEFGPAAGESGPTVSVDLSARTFEHFAAELVH